MWLSNAYGALVFLLVYASVSAVQGLRGDAQQLVAPSPKQMLKEELDKDKRPHLKLSLKVAQKKLPPMLKWEESIPKSSKWIVISTSRHPTSAIRSLVEQKDWSIVVVGMRDTPANWHLEGCVYLSVARQKELGYSVTNFLPLDSFTRKTIGYLFAFRHGAKVIYDTDDNSEVLKSPMLGSKNLTKVFFLKTGARVGQDTVVFEPLMKQPKGRLEKVLTRNVNGHFGQPNTWPRGFPLQDIGAGVYAAEYTAPGKDVRAYIQQIMANGDPDLDAIFRLTRKPVGKMIDFEFDVKAPAVVLPPGVVAPFNAKSTLFHKEAFWALALPPNKNDVVPDIWRAYVAQRLLGDIGGQVAFLPPVLYQAGQPRDLEADYALQHTLYYKTGALIEFLNNWVAPKGDFVMQFLQLIVDLAREGFYTEADAKFMEAYLNDLLSIGYTPLPVLQRNSLNINGKSVKFLRRNLQTSFAAPPVPSSICSNILLIVIFPSSNDSAASVARHRKLYGKMFKMVFYGPTVDEKNDVVGFEHTDGVFHQRAVIDAIKTNGNKGYDGYLYISANAILNYPHVLSVMDPKKIWAVRMKTQDGVSIASPPSKDWGHPVHGISVLQAKVNDIPKTYVERMNKAFGKPQSVVSSKADIGYIPRRFGKAFIELASSFPVTYEIAMPTVLRLLSDNPRDIMQFPHDCKYLTGKPSAFSVKPFHTIVSPVQYAGAVHARSIDDFQEWAEDRFVDICS